MNHAFRLRNLVVGLASIGLILPPNCLQGAEVSVPSGQKANSIVVPAVVDVGLGEGGQLDGRVLDAFGSPLLGAPVSIQCEGDAAIRVMTNDEGAFSVDGLKGGLYQVASVEGGRAVRLWAPGTAPPSAVDRLMIVGQNDVILGQREPGHIGRHWESLKCWLANPLVVGGIVAAAVAIPVAVHNANRDRDSGS